MATCEHPNWNPDRGRCPECGVTGEELVQQVAQFRAALDEKTREVEYEQRRRQQTDEDKAKLFATANDLAEENVALRAKVERAVETLRDARQASVVSLILASGRAVEILTAPPEALSARDATVATFESVAPSRSVQRRIAAQRGEPAPTFDEPSASPDRVKALDAWARKAWPDGRPGPIGDEPRAEAKPWECPNCDSGDITKAYRQPPGVWKCQSCGAVWRPSAEAKTSELREPAHLPRAQRLREWLAGLLRPESRLTNPPWMAEACLAAIDFIEADTDEPAWAAEKRYRAAIAEPETK